MIIPPLASKAALLFSEHNCSFKGLEENLRYPDGRFTCNEVRQCNKFIDLDSIRRLLGDVRVIASNRSLLGLLGSGKFSSLSFGSPGSSLGSGCSRGIHRISEMPGSNGEPSCNKACVFLQAIQVNDDESRSIIAPYSSQTLG